MSGARKTVEMVINAVIAVLALALVVMAVIVILAYSFPKSATRLGLDFTISNPAAAGAAGELASVTRGVLNRAQEGYDYRVSPILDRLKGTPAPTETASDDQELFPADSCVECHPNWKERPLFSVVYMPHERHREADVPCERCHEASGPSRDSVPPMSGCADCHDETEDGSKQCATCHPPGSLFHGAQLASSRTIGEQCDTCHTAASLTGSPRSHDMTSFNDDADSCSQCHTSKSCETCHPATHPKAYAGTHFNDLRSARRSQVLCYSCHSPLRCSGCHAARRGVR